MVNLLSSPSTDAAYGRDKEESRDASPSASELPSFPRISDDNDNGGRRSPVAFRYTTTDMGRKLGAVLPFLVRGSCVPIYDNVARAEAYHYPK